MVLTRPGELNWSHFVKAIEKTCLINFEESYSMFYTMLSSNGSQSKVHLKQSTFSAFSYYLKLNKQCNVSLYTKPRHSLRNALQNKSTRPKDTTSKETANFETDLEDRTGKQILCALQVMKWDVEFISNKLTREDRENAVREMIGGAAIKDTCLDCQKYHPIKKLDLLKLIDNTNTKLRKLFSEEELHMFFAKKLEVTLILGNGHFLLNPFHIQCPICGSLISLGHMNNIMIKMDKLCKHIDSSHFKNPLKLTHRGKLNYIFFQHTIFSIKLQSEYMLICPHSYPSFLARAIHQGIPKGWQICIYSK